MSTQHPEVDAHLDAVAHLDAAAIQARRAKEALALRDQNVAAARALGATYNQIAAALGMTKSGAQALVRRITAIISTGVGHPTDAGPTSPPPDKGVGRH